MAKLVHGFRMDLYATDNDKISTRFVKSKGHMNDGQEELIKAGAAEIARPFQELLLKLLGPAFDEVGGFFGDFFKHYRRKYAVLLLQGVETVIDEAHIETKPVPPKLLHNILEHASLENEDELRERWVFLLTNASDARNSQPMPIAFSEILKELSGREVRFLDYLYKQLAGVPHLKLDETGLMSSFAHAGLASSGMHPFNREKVAIGHRAKARVEDDKEAFQTMMDLLERNRLIKRIDLPTASVNSELIKRAGRGIGGGVPVVVDAGVHYSFTNLGYAFARACQKPIKGGSSQK